VKGAESLSAGFVLVGVSAVIALVGYFIGDALGSAVFGVLVGALVGIVVGFVVVYRVYVKPQRTSMESHDYSHLQPKLGDDE